MPAGLCLVVLAVQQQQRFFEELLVVVAVHLGGEPDQHGEGVVIEITALNRAQALREGVDNALVARVDRRRVAEPAVLGDQPVETHLGGEVGERRLDLRRGQAAHEQRLAAMLDDHLLAGLDRDGEVLPGPVGALEGEQLCAQALQGDPRAQKDVFKYPFPGTWYLLPQVTKAPFDNVNVRKALSISLNREIMGPDIWGSGEPPAYAWVPPGTGNPIDRLLAASLKKAKIAPAQIDDRTFARRVYLDVVGLPPTPG